MKTECVWSVNKEDKLNKIKKSFFGSKGENKNKINEFIAALVKDTN